MRKSFVAVAVFAGLTGAAHASVIYNLTLTDASSPTYSGTGSITLAMAPVAVGLTTYTSAQYSNINFTVDGQTFTSPPGTVSAVQFLNGNFYDITFAEQIGASPNRYSLQTTGNYAFYYNNLLSVATGTITSAPAVAAVPEPASLALLALPLGVAGVVTMRRRRTAHAA